MALQSKCTVEGNSRIRHVSGVGIWFLGPTGEFGGDDPGRYSSGWAGDLFGDHLSADDDRRNLELHLSRNMRCAEER